MKKHERNFRACFKVYNCTPIYNYFHEGKSLPPYDFLYFYYNKHGGKFSPAFQVSINMSRRYDYTSWI